MNHDPIIRNLILQLRVIFVDNIKVEAQPSGGKYLVK
jgi:hypothetical protein